MAISLKHPFQSAKGDGLDSTLVQPSNWNAEHALTLDTDNLVGRSSAGNGDAEEIPCTTFARSILAAAHAAAVRTLLALGSFATKSSLAFNELTGTPTTLSGYGITDAVEKGVVVPRTETADTSIVAGDAGKTLIINSSSQEDVTLQLNSNHAISANFWCNVENIGSANIRIVSETVGVDVNGVAGGIITIEPNGGATIRKDGTNSWRVPNFTAVAP